MSWLPNSVGGWERWVLLDTADTESSLDTDSDVTVLTPGSGPGVLDDVVLNTGFNTVTDGEDGVIELGSASLASVMIPEVY